MKKRGFIGGCDEAVKLALDAARRWREAFPVTLSAILELVRRMRREDFSRNRNYDAFEGTDGATRARRLWRYLRSLERDLAANAARIGAGVSLRIEPRAEGGRRITIEVPEVRMRRTAFVSAEEYALLRDHPDARRVLDAVEGGTT
jgi:hypothetical protein